MRINLSKVTAPEPAILGKGFTGRLFILIVAGKDIFTPDQDFLLPGLQFHVRQCQADRADSLALNRVDREHRGAFRQAVSLQQRKSHAVPEPEYIGIKRGAAGHEHGKLASELQVYRQEKHAPQFRGKLLGVLQ